MSKEKQIEEMRNIMETDCDRPCVGCELENEEHCFTHNCAIRIYNAGYRKQSEVIRCKDCEYFREYTDEYKRGFKCNTERADGDCHIRLMNTYLGNSQYCACKYDDFCSFAKAKGGAE